MQRGPETTKIFLEGEEGAPRLAVFCRMSLTRCGLSEEGRPEEMMDAAVHEDVVDAAAALRPEHADDVRPGLGDEESPGLEHEARRGETRLARRLERHRRQTLSKKS